jgi:hypothetical protein
MRVTMLLDKAGSIAQDGKMSAMQTAAKNLVDQLSGLVLPPTVSMCRTTGGTAMPRRSTRGGRSCATTPRRRALRERHRHVLSGDAGESDRVGLTYVAVEAARGALNRISVATTKKPG